MTLIVIDTTVDDRKLFVENRWHAGIFAHV